MVVVERVAGLSAGTVLLLEPSKRLLGASALGGTSVVKAIHPVPFASQPSLGPQGGS